MHEISKPIFSGNYNKISCLSSAGLAHRIVLVNAGTEFHLEAATKNFVLRRCKRVAGKYTFSHMRIAKTAYLCVHCIF